MVNIFKYAREKRDQFRKFTEKRSEEMDKARQLEISKLEAKRKKLEGRVKSMKKLKAEKTMIKKLRKQELEDKVPDFLKGLKEKKKERKNIFDMGPGPFN